MSVTAKQMARGGVTGKILDGIVREQLRIIDDKLLEAKRKLGVNSITVLLPVDLAQPGLAKNVAQLIVYCGIARSLQKRGLRPQIKTEEDRTILVVGWDTKINENELAAMYLLMNEIKLGAVPESAQKAKGSNSSDEAKK